MLLVTRRLNEKVSLPKVGRLPGTGRNIRRKRRSGQLLDKRLKATCMGLGMARLQLEAGYPREAALALGRIHEDLQHLRQEIEGKKTKLPGESYDHSPGRQPLSDWNTEHAILVGGQA